MVFGQKAKNKHYLRWLRFNDHHQVGIILSPSNIIQNRAPYAVITFAV